LYGPGGVKRICCGKGVVSSERVIKESSLVVLSSFFLPLLQKETKKSRPPNACLTAVRLQRALPYF
jgi:hypothetical protein